MENRMSQPDQASNNTQHHLDRRNFIGKLGRYSMGGLAAGTTMEMMLAPTYAALQTPSVQPADIIPPEIVKVRDNLYLIGGADATQSSSWTGGSNAVFITENHGVVLVDTKNPGWGRHMQNLVKSVTDKPITTIIVTHTHFDHTASNIEFPDTVDFVAHVNCVRSMSQTTCNFVTGCEYFQGENKKYLPKTTFTDRLSLFSGNDRIELYYYGAAHTDGDTIVHFPALNAIHPGDIYPGRYSPFIDTINGGSGLGYDNVLTKVVENFQDALIMPGHRDNPEAWAKLVEYQSWWRHNVDDVRAGMKAGKTADQIADEYVLPAEHPGFGLNTSGTPTRFKINTNIIYDELKERG